MIAKRLSRLYERRLRSYVYWKVRMDPAYRAVLERLRGREQQPLADLGGGVGILPLFLREHGFTGPIAGFDIDERKIAAAREAARPHGDVEFVCGDANRVLPAGHNVVLLDLLQYVDTRSQEEILANVARAVPPGGVVILRQGVRDESWRYRVTHVVDTIGRAIRWNRGRPMNFPTREAIVSAFAEFDADIVPLWGRTPYNNYLFFFTRRGAAGRPG